MYTRRVYNHIPGVVAAALTLFPAAVPYPGRNSFVPTTRHSGHAPRCRGRSCRRPPPRPAPPQCAQLCRAARRTRARARNARAVRVCVRRRCARARARVRLGRRYRYGPYRPYAAANRHVYGSSRRYVTETAAARCVTRSLAFSATRGLP